VKIQDGCIVFGWLGSSVDLAFFAVSSVWCFSGGGGVMKKIGVTPTRKM
jgi:hypothetical protein